FWKIYGVLKQLTPPPPEVIHRQLVVAIGIDWGMPGGLMHQVLDVAEETYEKHGADLLLIGKMTHARFKDKTDRTVHTFSAPKKSSLRDIEPIYALVSKYAHTTFVYPRFESLSKQVVETNHISIGDTEEQYKEAMQQQTKDNVAASRFIIEPDAQEISNYMNQTVVGLSLYHYIAESMLAYSAAQMVAMRNSYDNAKEASKAIRQKYHKARRAMIDAKLRELYGSRMSGDALKGNGKAQW
ncbi:F0F1 ATP synthase subunit gamma, partial [Candidatus Saccharibacteria bacterium]|nr:F0F1 ATP synthase subunit gamma [Candidatus Saccharibacteria bacterium]